jgi:hypothetical protein
MKTGVKLAWKTALIGFSTSGERPSLCSAKPDKKMASVNSSNGQKRAKKRAEMQKSLVFPWKVCYDTGV